MYQVDNLYDSATKPLIIQLQTRTGADLVILPSSFLDGNREEQHTVSVVPIRISGASLKALLQQIIYKSLCEGSLKPPQLQGVLLAINESNCYIYRYERCSWYVSQSYVCKRWSRIKSDDVLFVMAEEGYLQQIEAWQSHTGILKYRVLGPPEKQSVPLLVSNFAAKFSADSSPNQRVFRVESRTQISGFYATLIVILFVGLVSKAYLQVKRDKAEPLSQIGVSNFSTTSQASQ